jgi:hypothetical protein
MVKKLQQAKVDAINARASESMAQRKLADAEADLKRAKEEAAQATKEAEQARNDAQAAREAQAKAENKLADAERARVAAEESEKACQSAAKSQPGLGARLRSWFGHNLSSIQTSAIALAPSPRWPRIRLASFAEQRGRRPPGTRIY